MTMSQDQVRDAIADAGGSFDALVLGDVPGRTVLEWGGAWRETGADGDVIAINLCTRDADGTSRSSDLEIALRPTGPVIVGIDGRSFRGTRPNAGPVTLWRIEDADGTGPFKGDDATNAMDQALGGGRDGVSWHVANMPTPCDEDLDMLREHRCAATSPRTLVRWFPRRARRALAEHGYRVVALGLPAGTAQIGRTQSVYNPARAEVLSIRPLGAHRG